jgi:hypothetical protein
MDTRAVEEDDGPPSMDADVPATTGGESQQNDDVEEDDECGDENQDTFDADEECVFRDAVSPLLCDFVLLLPQPVVIPWLFGRHQTY